MESRELTDRMDTLRRRSTEWIEAMKSPVQQDLLVSKALMVFLENLEKMVNPEQTGCLELKDRWDHEELLETRDEMEIPEEMEIQGDQEETELEVLDSQEFRDSLDHEDQQDQVASLETREDLESTETRDQPDSLETTESRDRMGWSECEFAPKHIHLMGPFTRSFCQKLTAFIFEIVIVH